MNLCVAPPCGQHKYCLRPTPTTNHQPLAASSLVKPTSLGCRWENICGYVLMFKTKPFLRHFINGSKWWVMVPRDSISRNSETNNSLPKSVSELGIYIWGPILRPQVHSNREGRTLPFPSVYLRHRESPCFWYHVWPSDAKSQGFMTASTTQLKATHPPLSKWALAEMAWISMRLD